MNRSWKVSSGTGSAVAVVLSLIMVWAASNAGVSEALSRFWINFSSTENRGLPGAEALGMRREIAVESHGAGKSDLKRRRFFARNGQVLVLDYEVTVGGGYLRLSVDRVPFFGESAWGRTLSADRRETVRLPIGTTGLYDVTMTQYRHTGAYRVGWRLE
jgi:hypothetical protein